jgi:hypothetical protein
MRPVIGVRNPNQAVRQLQQEVSKRISPPLTCNFDVQQTSGKSVIRVLVPRGPELPYAIDDSKIYIRTEAETGLAVRDEIVRLIAKRQEPSQPTELVEETPAPKRGRGGRNSRDGAPKDGKKPARKQARQKQAAPAQKPARPEAPEKARDAPSTGVEVVSMEERDGVPYYVVRDLRNGMVVNNVTEKSARKLWHYAIKEFASLPKDGDQPKADWRGNFGLLKQYSQHKQRRYDFVQRVNDGLRYYFGVTEDGVDGEWREFLPKEEVNGSNGN